MIYVTTALAKTPDLRVFYKIHLLMKTNYKLGNILLRQKFRESKFEFGKVLVNLGLGTKQFYIILWFLRTVTNLKNNAVIYCHQNFFTASNNLSIWSMITDNEEQ